ncbi:MAG: hypothetical protein J3T61_00270 [Candidatus Brocadiales bacterium]|nr:hypothetical protein [Candidatus Bathyanammoxibius sp.]
MRKFKASRPDPVKMMEEAKDAAQEMHAADINRSQLEAEYGEFEKRMKAVIHDWNLKNADWHQRRQEAFHQLNAARDKMMTVHLSLLEAQIEDMKG